MKRWCLLVLGTVVGLSSGWIAVAPGLTQSRLELQSDPSLQAVVPFKQPITLALTAMDRSSLDLEHAKVQVKLLAPPRTPWLTTDFPIVEGSTLLDSSLAAPDGEATLQLMPPIRGNYQLAVSVSPEESGTFEPFTETLSFRIPENPSKYYNLLILLGILGVAGFGGGWVIGAPQKLRDGEIAPQPVRLLLSAAVLVTMGTLLYITITSEMADAHANHGAEIEKSAVESQPHPESLSVSLEDLAIAKVGQAIPLEIKISDAATGQPVTDVDLAITTDLLGYDETVMAFQATPDSSGQYTWKQQFFDGSPHIVRVQVSPRSNAAMQFESFELAKRIEVLGIAPPLLVRLLSLGYMTAFLAAGVGAGFWTRRRLQQNL